MTDYSQRGEQAHILKACENSERRTLLDIGAYHPTVFSNSRALIEQGWRGVLIEPSPGPLRTLVECYGNTGSDIEVVSAAVGTEPGFISIRISDDAVSSSDAAHLAQWEERGKYLGWLTVPCLTITQILERWGAFDFVNIDIEGFSVDVFKALLATEMFPKCIAVEHNDRVVEAQMAAQSRGYKALYVSVENLVVGLP